MRLRPYQEQAVEAVLDAWNRDAATLLVMATGLGKTVVFSHVLARLPRGRGLVLAHRSELIWQAAQKLEIVTGIRPDVEMGAWQADRSPLHRPRWICSTVQTQIAGRDRARMERFDPREFAAVVVDEAHHAPSDSYREVIGHYRRNPETRVLGVTATPDRADQIALGSVFGSVAFSYGINDGIADGWLVPVRAKPILDVRLDWSQCRTVAGDLSPGDVARVAETEEALHAVAIPLLDLHEGRRTLVFAATVAHAERLCEILNRYRPNSARWVAGETDRAERAQTLADFARGEFPFLVNVGVLTEGYDDPGIEVVAMARPTKSRALYTQMVGRGTRPLPGIVDRIADADGRRDAIAASRKGCVEVIDFVGNCGHHKLVTAADILGGNEPEPVVERARRIIEDADGMEVSEAMRQAREEIAREEEERLRREAEEERERQRRAAVRAQARYRVGGEVDVFSALGMQPPRAMGWNTTKDLTAKQKGVLERAGIDPDRIGPADGQRLVGEILRRMRNGEATYKQAKILARNGFATNVSKAEASKIIDDLFARRRQGVA